MHCTPGCHAAVVSFYDFGPPRSWEMFLDTMVLCPCLQADINFQHSSCVCLYPSPSSVVCALWLTTPLPSPFVMLFNVGLCTPAHRLTSSSAPSTSHAPSTPTQTMLLLLPRLWVAHRVAAAAVWAELQGSLTAKHCSSRRWGSETTLHNSSSKIQVGSVSARRYQKVCFA